MNYEQSLTIRYYGRELNRSLICMYVFATIIETLEGNSDESDKVEDGRASKDSSFPSIPFV